MGGSGLYLKALTSPSTSSGAPSAAATPTVGGRPGIFHHSASHRSRGRRQNRSGRCRAHPARPGGAQCLRAPMSRQATATPPPRGRWNWDSTPPTCASGSNNAPSSSTARSEGDRPKRALRRRSAAAADHRLRRSAAGNRRQPDHSNAVQTLATHTPIRQTPTHLVPPPTQPPLAPKRGSARRSDDVDRRPTKLKVADKLTQPRSASVPFSV